MITFAVETYGQCISELKEHFPRHWQELALEQERFPLAPQYEIYRQREEKGELFLVVGRSEGNLCAYFVGFVAPGLHYQTCMTLTMDIFWIAPEHRGRYAGVRLFKVVEQEAKRRGVDRIFVGSKLHKDAGWLFERLGYKPIEMYYSKLVGED